MTFRTTINSKRDPRRFLKRGLKSMFPDYGEQQHEATDSTPPLDTERDDRKKPLSR